MESMEEDMDLTEDDFGNTGQFSMETSTMECSNGVNGSLKTVTEDENVIIQKERMIHSATLDVSSKSGVKRPRTTSEEQQPSVHVTYKHLTRSSKQKLESLLQQWSEWEAEKNSLGQDNEQVLESGDETYYTALRVGLQKESSVSYWVDYQTGSNSSKEFVPTESCATPLYDRGFAIGLGTADGSNNVEGGLEIIGDPPRCFNCGAYSHSLSKCPKPINRSAISNARRQHKSKRKQTPGSCVPSRYYQSPQTGKYDGLKPGSLAPETRQLLSLGELDPPPWLNRMREIGYPPGYLADKDDHMSGITIFGEEEEARKEAATIEDGEVLERASPPRPEKKKTVEFPGINAPIPETADVSLWALTFTPSIAESQRISNRWQHVANRAYDHHHHHRRPALPLDCRDEGPPGVESPSSYPPRYHHHGFGSRLRSPTFKKSPLERGA